MKLYISGPMTGYEDFNYPAFHEAKRRLTKGGYVVYSPADLPLRDDWEWINYILVDIDTVFAVDGIAHLPGWEASKGACIETRIAENLGLEVKPIEDWL